MIEEEVITIVTMRVEDKPHPAPGSRKGFVCNDCGEAVWICDTSLPHMEDGYNICCNRCVGDKLLRDESPEMHAADPRLDEIFQSDPELKEGLIGYMIARSLKDSEGS